MISLRKHILPPRVQVAVLPISEKFADYAGQVHHKLLEVGLRSDLNGSADTVSAKIRQATLEKVPYMLVLGGKEAQASSLSVRQRSKGDLGSMALDEFIRLCHNEVQSRGRADE